MSIAKSPSEPRATATARKLAEIDLLLSQVLGVEASAPTRRWWWDLTGRTDLRQTCLSARADLASAQALLYRSEDPNTPEVEQQQLDGLKAKALALLKSQGVPLLPLESSTQEADRV
jgi:hypothetical protein